jgi:hypothetical protein
LGTWQAQDPRSKTLFDGGDGCVVNRKAQTDLPLNMVNVAELDARRPVLIKAEPLLDTSNQFSKTRVQPVTERGGPDQNDGQTERLVGSVVDHNAIDSTHLASVPIDHTLVQHIPDDIHISHQRFRGG